jgi:hypothetical protein
LSGSILQDDNSQKGLYGTEGNMTNGQSGKGNGFADRCVKAYDQLVLGKESNMVVGTLRTGAVISVFVIVAALFFYLIR